jgi:membrane associated rhomboid family serine protease
LFFFIPLYREDSRIHRLPVVCVGIVILCLLAFFATWPGYVKKQNEAVSLLVSVLSRIEIEASSSEEDAEAVARVMCRIAGAKDAFDLIERLEKVLERPEALGFRGDIARWLKDDLAKAKEILANLPFFRYGLVSSDVRPHALLSHMFLHAGYMHLIFNLLFFIIVGPSLEDLWGRVVFPIVYVLSGLAAAIGHMIVNGSSAVPMVGASGAIAGLMGAFLIAFVHARIRVLSVIVFRVVMCTWPAWVFFPIWIAGQILEGVLQLGASGEGGAGVAYWAHIAGFFFGAGVVLVMRVSRFEEMFFPLYAPEGDGTMIEAVGESSAYVRDPLYRKAIGRREEADRQGEEDCFDALVKKYPMLVSLRIEVAEMYRRHGEFGTYKNALLDALPVAAKARDKRILEIFEALKAEDPKISVSPECLFRIGTALEEAGRVMDAFECLKQFTERSPEHPQRTRAELQMVDLLAGPLKNPQGALELLNKIRPTANESVWREEVAQRLRQVQRKVARVSGENARETARPALSRGGRDSRGEGLYF